MRKKIFLILALLAAWKTPAQIFEKPCPSGFSRFEPWTTVDPVTKQYIANACMDANQNIFTYPLVPPPVWAITGATANMVNPLSSTYGVKADGWTTGDASTTLGQNTISTPTFSCLPSDAGKLVVATNPSTHVQLFGNGLTYVSTASPCTGTAWNVVDQNGNAVNAVNTNAGAAALAIGHDDCASAWTQASLAAWPNGKALAIPAYGISLCAEPPFTGNYGTVQNIQKFAVIGPNFNSGLLFVLHPNITKNLLVNGGTFFWGPQYTSTGYTDQGWGCQESGPSFLRVTSLGGYLPGTAGKNFALFGNSTCMNQSLEVHSLYIGAGSCSIMTMGGEGRYSRMNFQNGNCAASASSLGGQGAIDISDSIFAYGVEPPNVTTTSPGSVTFRNFFCIACAEFVFNGNYLSFIDAGFYACQGNGSNCVAVTGGGQLNLIRTQMSTQFANTAPITGNGFTLTMQDSVLTPVTAGYAIWGGGITYWDRGNNVTGPLTQFSGNYIPVGGGSMANSLTVASRNTALSAQTLVASTPAPTNLVIIIYASDSAAGSGCGANSTVTWTVSYTDQTGTGQTSTATETITTNGGSTGGDAMKAQLPITVNGGSTITVSASAPTGGGCTTVPSFSGSVRLT